MDTILFFCQRNCEPCQQLEKVLTTESTFVKIDMQDPYHQEDIKYYGVIYVPTLIGLRNGKEVKRHTGFQQTEDLMKFLYDL